MSGRNQLHGGPRGFRHTSLDASSITSPPASAWRWSRRTAIWVIRAASWRHAPIRSRGPPHCAIDLEAIADRPHARQSHHPRLFQSRRQPGYLLAPADDRGRLHHADATGPDPDRARSSGGRHRATISAASRPVGRAAIAAADLVRHQLRAARPPATLSHAATLMSLRNGLAMELWTTEPGLQFYDGHMIDIPVPGLRGAHYGPQAAFAWSRKGFPTAPIKPIFHALSSSRERHPARAPNIDSGLERERG